MARKTLDLFVSFMGLHARELAGVKAHGPCVNRMGQEILYAQGPVIYA